MSEQKDKKIFRKVTVMAVRSNYRTGIPFFMTPIFNQNTREYITGLEQESATKKGALLKKIGYSSATVEDILIPISHGLQLNIDESEEDYVIYHMALITPDIASSIHKVDPENHLFYLSDPEGEATEELTMELKVVEAKNKILEEGGDFEKLRALALYLGGMNLKGLSLNVVTRRLLKEAEMQPQKIIQFYEGDHGAHIMVKELEFYGVVDFREGRYYDGQKMLGSLTESIAYILDQKNSDEVNSLGKRLIEAKEQQQ